MAKRFLTNIDLNKNEIQNVVIHKLATAPANPSEGQIYYNTTDQLYYLRQASAWKDVTGRLDDVLSGTNALTVQDNGDGTVTLAIANATSANAGLLSSALYDELTNATNLATASTLVKRDASGNASFNEITITQGTVSGGDPTSPDGIATKNYVDTLVTSGMTVKGSIDASTNPNYPSGVVGDAYYISVAGKVGGASGEVVEAGDLIVVLNDNAGGDQATVGNDWMVLQNNIEASSETNAGTIRIATQTEVDAGTNNSTAVTPLKLATYVAQQLADRKSAVSIGDTVTTSFAISHNLGTTDVHTQIFDNTTKEYVETDIEVTDANTVTVKFLVPPSSNEYRVVIQG